MFTHEQLQSLNKLEMEVYNYVSKNRDKIPNMTIRQLANASHVSTMVVVRFCEKMGCRGYSEFKFKFEMYNSDTYNQLDEINIKYVLDFFRKIVKDEGKRKIIKAASLIADAKKIIFLGLGSSGVMAKYGSKYLTYMGKMCHHIDDPYFINREQNLSDAILIVLSVSGEAPHVVNHVNNFKQNGATIISITNSLANTIADLADVAISYDLPMENIVLSQKSINITTQIPVLYILESIARKVEKLIHDNEK